MKFEESKTFAKIKFLSSRYSAFLDNDGKSLADPILERELKELVALAIQETRSSAE